jgi:hypothetical protein
MKKKAVVLLAAAVALAVEARADATVCRDYWLVAPRG